MGHCKDCKHWDPYSVRPDYGVCREVAEPAENSLAMTQGVFWTNAVFGCVLFKAKS